MAQTAIRFKEKSTAKLRRMLHDNKTNKVRRQKVYAELVRRRR